MPTGRPPAKTASQHRGKRWLTVLAVLPVAGIGWLISGQSGHRTSEPPRDSTRVIPGYVQPPVTRVPSSSLVSWKTFQGFPLPQSAQYGPRCVTASTAACFDHSLPGAGFAAVHLLIRTLPFAGPGTFNPTITDQVVGRDKSALSRLTNQAYLEAAKVAGVVAGQALPSGGGSVAGYQSDTATTSGEPVTVHVLIHQTSSDDGDAFIDFTVRLTWQRGDWRLIAPAWGDWQTAARTTASADPAGYRSYDTPADPATPADLEDPS